MTQMLTRDLFVVANLLIRTIRIRIRLVPPNKYHPLYLYVLVFVRQSMKGLPTYLLTYLLTTALVQCVAPCGLRGLKE